MIDRLLLRKSKAILQKVESAEQVLKDAEQKLNELKRQDKFKLVREEIIDLIRQSNSLTNSMAHSVHFGTFHTAEGQRKDFDDVLKEIDHCLDSMEQLAKEKCKCHW